MVIESSNFNKKYGRWVRLAIGINPFLIHNGNELTDIVIKGIHESMMSCEEVMNLK